ncbi:MAG: cyanoexosortase B [Richelia sp. RM2_1_2]|nr:cyanoexosortase B [Richelia sp. SM2_1_7]NJM18878.1 cyanoexosortase B [Richelia sp. SM1_7_0]NJN06449.1 cyanoexosortase B [Richelia sp. RM1_1_1]NJO26332.1 cyanoexosortase B [Richelia sp. SL_2_1]NJO56996.1 cyanoexosortase B [Richelia sp. RM2_1_2]
MLTQHQAKNLIPPKLFDFAILAILILLYAPLIYHWFDGWLNKNISTEHEYFSHGMIGFPFAAYLVWMNRKKWQRLANKSNLLGGILLVIGGIFYLSGVGEWVNLSFPVILAGLCLWLKGIAGFKLQGFPLLLILLATPNSVPYLIAPFTLPLQSFIAGTAGFILNQFGLPIVVDGINIYANGRIVEVAPYCAGLKMLFTTMYVGLILLYWTETLSSRRKSIWFLSTAAIISVTANIIRNTLLTFFHATGQDGAFHWLHDSWGGDLYSALMLLTLIPVINWIDSYFSENSMDLQDEIQ